MGGLSTRAKDRKYSVTSLKIMNLPAKARNHWANVCLINIVASSVLKQKGGLLWSISGRGPQGIRAETSSFADEMLALERGVWIELISPITNMPESWRLKVFDGPWAVDWLSKQALSPCAESTSATCPCLDCKWISIAQRRRSVQTSKRTPPPAPKTMADPVAQQRSVRDHAKKVAEVQEAVAAAKEKLAAMPTNQIACAGDASKPSHATPPAFAIVTLTYLLAIVTRLVARHSYSLSRSP